MQLVCPKCASRETRVSNKSSFSTTLKALIGIYKMRCRRCRHSWETSAWANQAWRYARCPRCYRQDLGTWDTSYYSPGFSTGLLLALGAHPHRCEACRCNFASYRPRRRRYSRKHQDIDTTSLPNQPRSMVYFAGQEWDQVANLNQGLPRQAPTEDLAHKHSS